MNAVLNARNDGVPDPDVAVPECLGEIFARLERKKIAYCYWRSSGRIALAMSGASDVDLLVAIEDLHRFEAVLLEQDFKRFASVASRDHPSIQSFLGFDLESGRLIHLHVHSRLIIGEPLFKNYHLPWERVLLARAVLHPIFRLRTLDPASEALLLTARYCLERSRLDPVGLRNWRSVAAKFELDLATLRQVVSHNELRALAAELITRDAADIPGEILFDIDSPGRVAAASRQLKRHLAVHRSYNLVEARVRALGCALAWAAGRLNKTTLHFPRPWNRRSPGGGRVIAIIGVDGSGKSTAVATLKSWLCDEVDVLPVYFGSGDGRPSLLLRPLKLLVPLATRLVGTKPQGSSHGPVSDKPPGILYGFLLMVWATVLAMEKRKKLLSAHRGADRGLFVLTDRYPQDEISDFNDGPLLPRLSMAPVALRRFESRAYALARRLPPDLVLKLVVSKETAARREPDMSPKVIDQRLASVLQLKFIGAKVVTIDAQQPLDKVTVAVKREVWNLL